MMAMLLGTSHYWCGRQQRRSAPADAHRERDETERQVHRSRYLPRSTQHRVTQSGGSAGRGSLPLIGICQGQRYSRRRRSVNNIAYTTTPGPAMSHQICRGPDHWRSLRLRPWPSASWAAQEGVADGGTCHRTPSASRPSDCVDCCGGMSWARLRRLFGRGLLDPTRCPGGTASRAPCPRSLVTISGPASRSRPGERRPAEYVP